MPSELLQAEPIASLSKERCQKLRELAIREGKVKQWLTDDLGHLDDPSRGKVPDPLRVDG